MDTSNNTEFSLLINPERTLCFTCFSVINLLTRNVSVFCWNVTVLYQKKKKKKISKTKRISISQKILRKYCLPSSCLTVFMESTEKFRKE
jgi:hypothetical protein